MSRATRLVWLLAAVACVESIANPTGTCEPDDDGARGCYHQPDQGDQYLPDCQAPLHRELWRVFAIDAETAYVIPRPDGTGIRLGVCEGDDRALAALFERNGLCTENADPDVVNAMRPADALAITHALHERLVFTADGEQIEPWAPEGDMAAACDGPLAEAVEVQGACVWFRNRSAYTYSEDTMCTDEAIALNPTQAALFADALNEVYGIAP